VMNPEALRRPDDFVRHKALDALGDLALAGYPILGRYEASCAGHALNNQLVRALLDRPSAWRLTTAPSAIETERP
jgi:UDP-3-O-[3-hydroxymyristoyl] N-acetylglucosamine deacetylase